MKFKKGSIITFVMLWHISERKGGAEVQANFLAEELSRRGFVVKYVCQTNILTRINKIELVNGVEYHFIKSEPKFLWLNIMRYFKKLNKTKPDFIVQRNSSPILAASSLYSKYRNTKLIWICTDNLVPMHNYITLRFKNRVNKKKVGNLKYYIFYVSSVFSDFLLKYSIRGVDLAFHQNEYQKKSIKKNFNLLSYKMLSGNIKPIGFKAISKNKQKKSILWCANLGKHKRPEIFIDLARSMLDTDYNFILIGGHSDKSYESKLFKNIPNNLKITGQLSYENSLSYFNKASIFVNTSTLYGDGFPNTFIQSWFRGIPVLSFNINPDQIIIKNNLGFVVNSIKDAKRKSIDLLTNVDLYKEISKNVLDYANKNHTIEKMTDNFLKNLIENL